MSHRTEAMAVVEDALRFAGYEKAGNAIVAELILDRLDEFYRSHPDAALAHFADHGVIREDGTAYRAACDRIEKPSHA